MNKNLLKTLEKYQKILAILICMFLIIPPIATIVLNIMPVYADEYVPSDDDDDKDNNGGVTYYVIEGKELKDLFNFTLSDALKGQKAIDWLFSFKTFTVIKEDSNNSTYTYYFNTPNLQSIVKNQIIKGISDGYTDNTYDVNDTEKLVDVGKKTSGSELYYEEENAIQKYGFAIPSYTYMGEYPKETMSTAGILPTHWYDTAWRFIKSLFGCSFIEAPDADNFKTITYHNHGYKDDNYWLSEFFQDYYYDYFVAKIADTNWDSEYFTDVENMLDLMVTEEDNKNAEDWNNNHKDEIAESTKYKDAWDTYTKTNFSSKTIVEKPEVTANVNCFFETNDSNLTEAYKNRIFKSAAWQNSWKSYVNTYKTEINSLGTSNLADTLIISESSDADTWITNYDKYLSELVNVTEMFYKDGNDYVSVSPSKWDDNKTCTHVKTKNATKKIPIAKYKGMLTNSNMLYCHTFTEDDFLSQADKQTLTTSSNNKTTMENYKTFTEKMDMGTGLKTITEYLWKGDSDNSNGCLFYKQCLIQNEGDDGECYSTAYGGDKTTITIASLYGNSGLYKTLDSGDVSRWDSSHPNYEKYGTKLSEKEAIQVINKIKSYCGPYYSDVMSSLVSLISISAIYSGDYTPFITMHTKSSDVRIMPYDTDTMTVADKTNYAVNDPRVEIYKSHIIGTTISDLSFSGGFGIFFKPQKTLINIGGRITEVGILFQRLCNFDQLDKWGLSPVDLWKPGGKSTFINLVLVFVVAYFFITTLIAIIKMGTRSLGKIIVAVIILLLEVGFFGLLETRPKMIWNRIKTIETDVMNLGESLSILATDDTLSYLYGGVESREVTYYLPYLDMWSKYNTGYGILADEQLIDIDSLGTGNELPELQDLYNEDDGTNSLPKIDGKDIQHYSVVLMDSFSYYGDSNSVANSVISDGKTVNGNVINHNAYRVVDHFLAPRVSVEPSGNNLKLSVKTNENYNDEFQSGFLNLLVKLLTCILSAFLSLVKFLTFIWQWWMIYILIFRIILGKGPEGKKTKDIIIETFAPVVCIIIIGLYSALAIWLGMKVEGLVGLGVLFFLFWVTIKMMFVWKKMRHGTLFPQTLTPITLLLDSFDSKVHHRDSHRTEDRNIEDIRSQATFAAKEYGFDMTYEETDNLVTWTKKHFDDAGNMRIDHDNELYNLWYARVEYEIKQHGESSLDEYVLRCYRNYKVRRKSLDRYNRNGTKKKSDKKINHNSEFNCSYCGETFNTIEQWMAHNKICEYNPLHRAKPSNSDDTKNDDNKE